MRAGDTRRDFVGRNIQHLADQPRDHVGIRNFRGHREGRIHAGTLIASGFMLRSKNLRAARAHVHDQPLLMLRTGIIFSIADKLQVGQTPEHRPGPYRREGGYDDDPAPGTAKIHIFAGNSGPNSLEDRARPSGRAAPVHLSEHF